MFSQAIRRPISANPGLNFNPGFFDLRTSRNGRGPLFGRCSLGRDLLLVLLSLLFMQLSKFNMESGFQSK